jgi:hypothetical protein
MRIDNRVWICDCGVCDIHFWPHLSLVLRLLSWQMHELKRHDCPRRLSVFDGQCLGACFELVTHSSSRGMPKQTI